jgi:FAD binding domain
MHRTIEINHASGKVPGRSVRHAPEGRVTDDQLSVPAEAYHELAHALARTITGEVRFDAGSRALYATDASNYRQVPIGVVIPRTTEDVVETIRLCRSHRAPIVNRGGGTALAGQGCNVAVLIDFSKYLNRVIAIDPDKRIAEVELACLTPCELPPSSTSSPSALIPPPTTTTHLAACSATTPAACTP